MRKWLCNFGQYIVLAWSQAQQHSLSISQIIAAGTQTLIAKIIVMVRMGIVGNTSGHSSLQAHVAFCTGCNVYNDHLISCKLCQ